MFWFEQTFGLVCEPHGKRDLMSPYYARVRGQHVRESGTLSVGVLPPPETGFEAGFFRVFSIFHPELLLLLSVGFLHPSPGAELASGCPFYPSEAAPSFPNLLLQVQNGPGAL